MKYLVGISGGLDSASAARMLLDQGETVEGAFLKMFPASSTQPAENTAKELNIRLHIIDCTRIFEEQVLDRFADSYYRGMTPNPCVECNRYVKIRMLCDLAEELGFDKVVTGHYGAVVRSEEGRLCVVRSENRKKDQSYVLWGLSQKQLAMMELPLYRADKEQLRREAEKREMSSAGLKESMDICFLPEGDYAGFLEKRRGACPPGEYVDEQGKVLGRHKGIIHYTVGQRKGLGIAMGKPMYISAIHPESNRITLVPAGGEYGNSARIEQLNFQGIAPRESGERTDLTVKLRYQQEPVPVRVFFEKDRVRAEFDSPVRAVTPGQSAVFYKDDRLAFGGYIMGT